jgi:hypothetical protein
LVKRLGAIAEEMSAEAFAELSEQEIETVRSCLARIRECVGRAEAAQKGAA